MARKAKQFQLAANAIAQHKFILRDRKDDFADRCHVKISLEECKLLWAQKEHSTAIDSLQELIDSVSTNSLNLAKEVMNQEIVDMLRRAGKWMASLRVDQPQNIMDKYLKKAVDYIEVQSLYDSVGGRAFFDLAKYVDEQYQAMLNSQAFATSQALFKHKEKELEACQAALSKMSSKEKSSQPMYLVQMRKLQVQVDMDRQKIQRALNDRLEYLLLAIEHYLKCLVYDDQFDMSIFRLCSLWFQNAAQIDANSLIAKYTPRLQTRKFIPLIYQLAARISCDSRELRYIEQDPFQIALNKLIERMAIDHPHHTCYQLFALRHGNVGLSHSKRYRKLDASTIDEKKINAATRILEKLKTIPSVREKYVSTEKLCYGYIELAGIDLSSLDKKKIYNSQISFDRNSKISALKNLVHVPVPTRNLPVNPDCVYSDFVYISEFLPKYSVVGGINMPKVIECRGSDGQLYKQLVKGNDDLRQDAVMEQVFTIVDHMLRKNKSTRKRNLGVRTYIVIPLSPVSGLLEWVKDTIPIGNYLQPAHAAYHPEDLKYNVCRKVMMEELEPDAKSKYQVFSKKIIPRFRPVFRHFFHENFHDAKIWFERRLAYTRSVASTSMTGYILGLGDRHAQNILIDKNTAELIHIDLGIAFDQGKMLKYPELVPFRLTRDIVDAMGCTGIEGVFRRCCEETLNVLRNESTALLTILEVLKYDPLYNWSLSPLKAKKIEHRDSTQSQDSDPGIGAFTFRKNEEEGNKEAERAIFRVKEKLTGVEEGTSLSLSGQVAYLISSASNPELLCQLYPGWSPFL
ncbi:hypothetical protein K493DRAFT_288362 [Basidiobolus meristosporus CBS 931.73]|uniref:Serine/threonine-protein kinase ATM n=1 Tax=Basidiobolus meristosporus CBS 931.73 TaxID=1314790 RepID=A0A1Y1XWT3_9FUNG|nr:hypothetical protein K493DRAFT_288362 [Basidiobolus meristosporus CBS 931.73]|eukprot:ORX90217.1 hypothetical protein K493DRAFT_288362 [Basidiobolus meristosporus CBS 931.73]